MLLVMAKNRSAPSLPLSLARTTSLSSLTCGSALGSHCSRAARGPDARLKKKANMERKILFEGAYNFSLYETNEQKGK